MSSYYDDNDIKVVTIEIDKNNEDIEKGNIKECLFCPPEQIYDWIKNDYQLFRKL